MSNTKSSVISVGHGHIKLANSTSRIFASNAIPATWNSTTTYNLYDCVEYAGTIYRALSTHANQTPVISSNYWELLFHNTRDGDICILTNTPADIYLRTHGEWVSIAQTAPKKVTLLDNQSVAVEIFRYSSASFKVADINYEIRRSGGNAEIGLLKIVTDGVNNFSKSNSYMLHGGSTGVSLEVTASGGDIIVSYISTLMSESIVFSYTHKGW